MNETTRPNIIKKKQQRNLVIVLIVAVIVMSGLYSMLDHHSSTKNNKKEKNETIELATPVAHVDPQSIWVERAQNQLAQTTKSNDALKQQLQLLQQSKETQDKAVEQQGQTLQDLQMQVTSLQKQLADQKAGATMVNQNNSSINDTALPLVKMKSNIKPIPSKNPDTFVPAGAFVRAIAIGGADASAGVSSQANPTPMLFRLLEAGTLPNARKSHLKDCVATAAAIGDISAERGAVRLERLSCTKLSGEVIELPVEATVFGPDGKDGIRGTPLWREGALLQRAFAAGTLSGISDGIAQSYTTSSLNAWGGTTQSVDNGKILQYGVANGMGNAADKLAEYNIKRAEQYHPVIQLSAGTVVDIVFLKGFYLDGRKEDAPDYLAPASTSENVTGMEMSDDASNAMNVNNSAPSPLPLTPQQIQTLKQKNAQGYL